MKKNIHLLLFSVFLFLGVNPKFYGQKFKVKRAAIAMTNVENLWDTLVSVDYIDGTKNIKNPAFHRSIPVDSIALLSVTEDYKGVWSDENLIGKKVIRYQGSNDEFSPKSNKRYGSKIYRQKLANHARVISELGRSQTAGNPVLVGLIEVENRQVVQDLIAQPQLASSQYKIIHYNSYDYRGIDVALIYQPSRFVLLDSYKKEVIIFGDEGKREYTRDVLVARGLLDGEMTAVFMNHWPSRRGGDVASEPKRIAAAATLRKEMDAMREKFPGIKLVSMGDYNDDPVNTSLSEYLGAAADAKSVSEKKPYINLMYPLFKSGVASLAYRDAPNLFDQIIVSPNLVSDDKTAKDYKVFRTEIYAPDYLKNTSGQWKGYPFRSWDGDNFTGGYSDHFPAVVVLQKRVD